MDGNHDGLEYVRAENEQFTYVIYQYSRNCGDKCYASNYFSLIILIDVLMSECLMTDPMGILHSVGNRKRRAEYTHMIILCEVFLILKDRLDVSKDDGEQKDEMASIKSSIGDQGLLYV